MNFIVSASTDVGNKKSVNQDSYGIKVIRTKQGEIVFAILCDGMGGLSNGEVASATLVSAFYNWVDSKLPIICENEIIDEHIKNDWTQIVVDYNKKIKAYGIKNGIRLGTTVTAILITSTRYFIINIGDTRAYEISDHVEILTQDQTLVAREVALGLLTEEEAECDPRRSILLQCVGASECVHPDIFYGNTLCNAIYMLCSDGFRHKITSEEIFDFLRPEKMLDARNMKENMDELIYINKKRKEMDNITVLTIRTF